MPDIEREPHDCDCRVCEEARTEVKRLRADRDRWRREHGIAARREQEWKARALKAEADLLTAHD